MDCRRNLMTARRLRLVAARTRNAPARSPGGTDGPGFVRKRWTGRHSNVSGNGWHCNGYLVAWSGLGEAMGVQEQSGPSVAPGGEGCRFETTRWSVVIAAGRTDCSESRDALSTLCGLYWYPLYAYARRRGLGADEAADLTQGFFARLLEQKFVRGADRRRGKFRSYLLGAFKHFLSHEWARARAQKRGGGLKFVALDPQDAEARYGIEPSHDLTADKLFEKQWALRVLELAMEELRNGCVRSGKEWQFERFKPFLSGGSGAEYRDAGLEMGLSEGAVRVLVHRLRRKYRELLREQIRRTVDLPEEVEEEIRHLFAAIGS